MNDDRTKIINQLYLQIRNILIDSDFVDNLYAMSGILCDMVKIFASQHEINDDEAMEEIMTKFNELVRNAYNGRFKENKILH